MNDPSSSSDPSPTADELLARIDRAMAPRHVAIIMDGNGRWAKGRGYLERIRGHEAAVDAVRAAVRGCGKAGVKALTLYAFSTENWSRPQAEVTALMKLLERYLATEIEDLNKNNVRLVASGELDRLPKSTHKALDKGVEALSQNTGLVANLALSYGGRQEIVEAAQSLARDVADGKLKPDEITTDMLGARMYQPELGDPDLLIRTSGEMRISNFMLWQIAYTEIIVMPTLWPDFREPHLYQSILDYQARDRRYGGV